MSLIKVKNTGIDGITIASTGVVTIPKQAGMYEHIESKVSTSNSQLSTSASIRFQDVFTTEYIAYKLVIGFYGSAHTSGAHDINMRWMNGSSEITDANYRWHAQEMQVNSTSYVGNAKPAGGSNDDRMRLFRNLNDNGGGTDSSATGLYGEINMYGVIATVIGGTNTDRAGLQGATNTYAPMMSSDLVGYNEAQGTYLRCNSFGRYNNFAPDTNFTGFAFMCETGEIAGTYMSLYGLRVHA